jgi:cytochrome c-type biogenesis protein CcmE
VATGRMDGQVFVAEQVLAKHDETYVPKEVADKMGLAHKKHNVAEANGSAPPATQIQER